MSRVVRLKEYVNSEIIEYKIISIQTARCYLARYWISSDILRKRFPEMFNAVSGEKSYMRDVMCLAPIPDRSRLSCSSISSSTVSTSNCDLELAKNEVYSWYYNQNRNKNRRRVPRKRSVHATPFDNCLRVFGNVALAVHGVVLVN